MEDDPLLPYRSLTVPQRQDIRASQRTFEGAYLRTAAGELSFGLVILRLFSKQFTRISIIYMVNCIMLAGLGVVQRRRTRRLFLTKPSTVCTTNGSTILFATLLTICTNIALLITLAALDDKSDHVHAFFNP